MEVNTLAIEGLLLFTPKRFSDDRGYFMETFQEERYSTHIAEPFVQDNLSHSNRGVLRGLHLQLTPKAQGKLVQVLQGSVLDVALDLRAKSVTYGQYVSVELSALNGHQLYIPPGFAHGFQALEDNTIFSYKCTEYYSSQDEVTIRWNDPELHIKWPLNPPVVSSKDEQGVKFSSFQSPF